MKILKTLGAALAMALVLALAGCAGGSGSSDENRVLILSDVHFNPFYDPSLFDRLLASEAEDWEAIFESSGITFLSGYGEEANYLLLEKALDDMAAQEPDPGYVIFPGDILAHHFNDLFYQYYGSVAPEALHQFIFKTMEFFALQIRERYDTAPVFFTLGNNDSYAGDYALVPGGEFLEQSAALFMAYFLAGAETEDYAETYLAGGYYQALINGGSTSVISLCSVLFSHKRPEPTPPGPGQNAAWDQLDWLADELEEARAMGRDVLMVTHVPPGADIFSTQHKYLDDEGVLSNAELLWHTAYHERFLELSEEYRDLVTIIYAGHTHMDEYRLVAPQGADYPGTPVLVTPAISPLFSNNPGYKIARLHDGGPGLKNFEVHTMDLNLEEPVFAYVYDFKDQYGLGAPNPDNLDALYRLMAGGDETAKDAYILHYYGGNTAGSPIRDLNWPVYLCGIKAMSVQGEMDCVNGN